MVVCLPACLPACTHATLCVSSSFRSLPLQAVVLRRCCPLWRLPWWTNSTQSCGKHYGTTGKGIDSCTDFNPDLIVEVVHRLTSKPRGQCHEPLASLQIAEGLLFDQLCGGNIQQESMHVDSTLS
jgi:hypothetical protein